MIGIIFSLIALPYAPDALEPVISRQTIEYHYGKHLQAYVDNLNKLVAGTEFEAMPLEDIVCKSQGAIFNNAGQILNHNLYFLQFKAYNAADPSPVTPHPSPLEVRDDDLEFARLIGDWCLTFEGCIIAFCFLCENHGANHERDDQYNRLSHFTISLWLVNTILAVPTLLSSNSNIDIGYHSPW